MSLLGFIKGESPGFIESIPHVFKGKGHYGEYLTEYALGHDNLPGRLEMYSNVLVPRKGVTSTSEIDVLMLHEKGIFLFESKNYSGWIFGSEKQQNWTVSLKGGRKEHFYNPIKQNAAHVRALAKWLDQLESVFRSYIVFSERCELKKVPDDTELFCVLRRQNLVRMMKKDLALRSVLFDEKVFEEIKRQLDSLSEASTKEARKEHIEEAKKVAAGVVCPRCGADLVERQRKSDGHTFIACSAFPKCRYARDEW